MKFLQGDRATGKTFYLLEWFFGGELLEGTDWWSRVILVPDHGQVEFISQALQRRFWYWNNDELATGQQQAMLRNVATLGELSRGHLRGAPRELEIAVDNFDMMLMHLFGGRNPSFMTTTEEVEVEQLAPGHRRH